MPLDKATLDKIFAADTTRPVLTLRKIPNIDGVNGGSLATHVSLGDGGHRPPVEAEGDDDVEAVDNLLLELEGQGDQVRQAIRVRKLRKHENDLETLYLTAKAAREAEEVVVPPDREVG